MVNIFIPYKDINKSITSFHIRSISTMLREINIILKAIKGETKGYKNHPITLMWKNNFDELVTYQGVLMEEYLKRLYPRLYFINQDGHFDELALQEFINTFDDEFFQLQRQHLRFKGVGYKTDWYEKQYPNDITKQGYKVLINNKWVYYPKNKVN
jgi:hypothetical protein